MSIDTYQRVKIHLLVDVVAQREVSIDAGEGELIEASKTYQEMTFTKDQKEALFIICFSLSKSFLFCLWFLR